MIINSLEEVHLAKYVHHSRKLRKVNRHRRYLFLPSKLGTYLLLLPITWNFYRFRQGHFCRNPQFPIKGQYYLGTTYLRQYFFFIRIVTTTFSVSSEPFWRKQQCRDQWFWTDRKYLKWKFQGFSKRAMLMRLYFSTTKKLYQVIK